MNPFVPIIPKDSSIGRPSAQRRSRVRMAFFVVLAINVLVLTVLLIQGCIHTQPRAAAASTAPTNALASCVTNAPAPARSPVAVSSFQSQAPLVSAPPPTSPPAAPVVTPKAVLPLATPERAVKNYSVVKGDTYYRIAKASGASVSALAKANPGVDPAKLRIGQVLRIPVVGQKQTSPQTTATPASVKDRQ